MAAQPASFGPGLAGRRFRIFRRQLNELWEGYELVREVLPGHVAGVKAGQPTTLQIRSYADPRLAKPVGAQDLPGVVDRYLARTLPSRTLIQAVGYLELLIGDVVSLLIRDFPAERLSEQPGPANDRRETKLLAVILESDDKAEMIDRLAEEKVRGLTYGNPADFFVKDSGRLQFGDHFQAGHAWEIGIYGEATARRNLWVHNDGLVDRKYLREITGSTLALGRTATITDAYLADVMRAVRTLGTCATYLAVQKNYGVTPRGLLAATHEAIHPNARPAGAKSASVAPHP